MKAALVYDRLTKWGGAERLLLSMRQLYPDAPLFTAVYNPKTASWANGFSIIPSFLQKMPFMQSHHEWFASATPVAFELFDFDGFDIVISITSSDAKGILTKPDTFHVCYCLTPTRYLWHQENDYIKGSVFAFVPRPFISQAKRWDMVASSRPDAYIAISKAVKNRIWNYYHRVSELVYPPISDTIYIAGVKRPRLLPPEHYFLVVSRLVSYKHVEVAIEACRILHHHLVVVGKGLEKNRLKSNSGSWVTYVSDLTDAELNWYYRNSIALLAPQEEDFGLSYIESLANGTPIIAYNKGSAGEIVEEDKNGILFEDQNTEALVQAIKRFQSMTFSGTLCKQSVERFSQKRFCIEFNKTVQKLYLEYKKINY